MVITIKGKLMVCFMICLVVHIPLSYATSPSWGYRIDEISVSVMTKDGNKVLVGTSSGTYYLFNDYGEIIGQENLVDEIMSVDISEESMILGTESATFILSLSGRKILNLPGKSVLSAAISENESCAISGNDGNIFIFPSLRSSKQINVGNPVNYVSISSDGEQAAAATSDTVFFLTIDENVSLYEFSIPYITSMQLSRDGEFLVVGTKEGSLYLLGRGRELLFKKDLTGSVTSVEMSGNTILACTSVGKIHLFDLTGTEIQHVTIDEILDCDISLDGRFIIAANSQELYMLSEYGEILWQKDIDNIKSVEISSDGKYVTAVTSDGIFFFCNWTDTFREVYYYPNPSKEHYSFDNFKEMWDYPVSFVENLHNRQPNKRVAVGDVNGDGENEIVISAGKDLVVLDSERNIISEKTYTKEVLNVALMDLNNNIVPEIVYTFSDGKYGVFVMDVRKEELEEISEFDFSYYFGVSTKEKKEGGIIPVVSYDIDGDGKTEILAVVCSGYTLKPRGILAFEYPSGDIEWFYESAPLLIFDAFYDIDGDGNPEIILGSHSCSNGNTVGDRDDCHAYLTVLDLDGKEVWNKEIGPEFKVIRAGAGDVNKDGEVEIVGTVLDANNICGELFVMDNKGNILKEREFSASFSLGGIVDFDGDGYMEIVTTDSDGNIRIFNFELESIESREIAPYQRSEVEGITDMDGDGDKEIILRVQEDRLIVLDGNLEEKWSKEFENLRPVVLVTNVSGCGNDLLVLTHEVLELYSFEGESDYLCDRFVPLSAETPESTPSPELLESSSTVVSTFISLFKDPVNLGIIGFVITLIAFLKMKYKTIRRFTKRKRITPNLMILSLEKRTETAYQISLESVNKTIYPVRSFRTIDISPKMRSEIIKRIEYTSEVVTNYLDPDRKKPLKTPTEELKKMGTVIYKNFIPRDFTQEFIHQYIVLDVEDVQVPWELMYDDEFFALKYALSRRIKSEKVSEIYKSKKRERKALIIADPTGTTPEAVTECEYLRRTLQDSFAVTYLKPEKAKKVDVMYHLSQNYDIIHYAGELRKEPCLPVYKDVLTCAEIERTLEGSPVVFLNGCGSAKTFSYSIEGLAEVFLNRGALSYIGSLWSIHDRKAAEIAAEFYRNCLSFPVGEALRLSRKNHYSPEDITWAAFVMYGDPTLNLFS